MSETEAATAADLDERVLLADVVDMLRYGQPAPVESASPSAQRLDEVRAAYRRIGIQLPDHLLAESLAALTQGRFAYRPPRGAPAALARLYVSRRLWGLQAAAVALVLVLALAGYFLGYRPYEADRSARAAAELQQVLPARIDDLYQEIFDETKVQTAADEAARLRDAGKAAVLKGDRAGAEQAISGLTTLRDKLDQAFTVHLASADGKHGFWTFPPSNSEATNYYIIVEATGPDGKVLSLPIASDDTGTTTTVSRWGLRVPQYIYEAVMAGRTDQGFGPGGLVGVKQDGFVDIDYAIPVLGGTLTQW